MNEFLNKLMACAKEAGIEACEAYVVERDSFKAMVNGGEVVEYNTNATRGLGFRGMKGGRMGYASTEAFDEDAIAQLVRGVVESAELSEDTDPVFLYDGKEEAPVLKLTNDELDAILLAGHLKMAEPYKENQSYNKSRHILTECTICGAQVHTARLTDGDSMMCR